jgi:hypothetical protein
MYVLISILVACYVFHLDSIHGLALSPNVHFVPKIDKALFDKDVHYYHSHKENGNPYETPVLVTNALSKDQREEISEKIQVELRGNTVDLQRKMKVVEEGVEHTETDIYQVELEEAFGYLMESHHNDCFFCFCEGLLEDNEKFDGVRETLQHAKESLFNTGSSQDFDDQNVDLFQHFPDNAKPSDCLVAAGEGATSTLHRDPFCWTGTSLCIEGTKIWRFVAPPGFAEEFDGKELESGVRLVDDALQSYRLPSVAWDNDYISSGWQSDLSLYSQRSDDLPSAEAFAMMEETNPMQKIEDLDHIASSLDILKPSSEIPAELGPGGKYRTQIWTVVQNPGDLLVIPAYWWHQTYAAEPSIAIASQRGGSKRDTKRAVSHILDTVQIDKFDDALPPILKEVMNDSYTCSQEKVADALFQVLSSYERM